MWKFWKKKNSETKVLIPDFEITSKEVPVSTIARWYLYDTELEEPNKIAQALGLTPVSDEGDETERKDSNIRLDRLEPFMNFINILSDINSSAMVAIQQKHLLEDHPEREEALEEEKEMMLSLYKQVSFVAIFAALSSGLELGIISNPGTFSMEEVPHEHE